MERAATKKELAEYIGKTPSSVRWREDHIRSLFGELTHLSLDKYDALQDELSNLLHYARYEKNMTYSQIGRIIYPKNKHCTESTIGLMRSVCFKKRDTYYFFNKKVIDRLLKLKKYLIDDSERKIKSYERKILEEKEILKRVSR